MDLLAIIFFCWARWLSKQPGTPPWLRFLPPVIVFAFVLPLGTVVGLLAAFRSVENVNPSEKATRLAEGISHAMTFTAAAITIDAIVLVLLIIVTLTRSRAEASPR